MGGVLVHEFITIDGVIENPAWTADYGFDPQMGAAVADTLYALAGAVALAAIAEWIIDDRTALRCWAGRRLSRTLEH